MEVFILLILKNESNIGYLDGNKGHITVHYYQKTVNGVVYKSGFKFKP